MSSHNAKVYPGGYQEYPCFRMLVPVTDAFATPLHVTLALKQAQDGGSCNFYIESLRWFKKAEMVSATELCGSSAEATYLFVHPFSKSLGRRTQPEIKSQVLAELGECYDDSGLFGKLFTQLKPEEKHYLLGNRTIEGERELLYEAFVNEALKYFVQDGDMYYLVHCWSKPGQKLSTWRYWGQSEHGSKVRNDASDPEQGLDVGSADAARQIFIGFAANRGQALDFPAALRFDGEGCLKKAMQQKLLEQGISPKIIYAASGANAKFPGLPVFVGEAMELCAFFNDAANKKYCLKSDATSLDDQLSTIEGFALEAGKVVMNTRILGGQNPPGGRQKVWPLPSDQLIYVYTKLDKERKGVDGQPSPQLWTVFVVESDWMFEKQILYQDSGSSWASDAEAGRVGTERASGESSDASGTCEGVV